MCHFSFIGPRGPRPLSPSGRKHNCIDNSWHTLLEKKTKQDWLNFPTRGIVQLTSGSECSDHKKREKSPMNRWIEINFTALPFLTNSKKVKVVIWPTHSSGLMETLLVFGVTATQPSMKWTREWILVTKRQKFSGIFFFPLSLGCHSQSFVLCFDSILMSTIEPLNSSRVLSSSRCAGEWRHSNWNSVIPLCAARTHNALGDFQPSWSRC